MKARIEFNKMSQIVRADSKLPLVEIEKWLKGHGYSLGLRRIPKRLRLGGALEKRFDRMDEICIGISADTKWGKIDPKPVPGSATGPDFKKLFIGSRGIYGKITGAWLRVRRREGLK